MFRYLLVCAVVLVVTISESNAVTYLQSASSVVSGCRLFDGPATSHNPRHDPFGQGYCVGLLEGLDYEGVQCRPREVTLGQIVRVVVHYTDSRPARLHEDFRVLAIEAMKSSWPCR
jgi:hypothetical protein